MSDKTKGIYKKYDVSRVDGKPIKGGCLVLEFGDKNAASAINEFAKTLRADGYEKLADDIEQRHAECWDSMDGAVSPL